MSIIDCCRNGCQNICCDRYSPTHGHICNECFEQLVGSHLSIERFMDSPKSEFMADDGRREWLQHMFKEVS